MSLITTHITLVYGLTATIIGSFLTYFFTIRSLKKNYKMTEIGTKKKARNKSLSGLITAVAKMPTWDDLKKAMKDQKSVCDNELRLELQAHTLVMATGRKDITEGLAKMAEEKKSFSLLITSSTADIKKYTEDMVKIHGNLLNVRDSPGGN